MSNSIEQAIKDAQQAAAAQVIENVPAPITPAPVTQVVTPGAPLSFSAMASGNGLSVDHWLKVNEFGLMSLGKDNRMIKQIFARLDLSQVRYCYQIKYGQPVKYKKTYDRVVSTEQKAWHTEVENATRIDPKAYEYRSADVPFTLIEPAKAVDGAVVATAGQKIGKSLSATEFKPYTEFVQALYAAGYETQGQDPSGVYDVVLTCEGRVEPGKKYGILRISDPKPVSN